MRDRVAGPEGPVTVQWVREQPVTVQWVREQLALIRQVALLRDGKEWDDEVAHNEEDRLHQIVLAAIASGHVVDPAACAAEALLTLVWPFRRWCA